MTHIRMTHITMQTLVRYRRKNTYRNSRAGSLLRGCTDAQHKDNEILRAVNKQLIAKCENFSDFLVVQSGPHHDLQWDCRLRTQL